HCNGDGHWGLGWIVRKEDGSCLGATTRTVSARTAMEAEALGLVVVLQSINQQEGRTIIIEMDSKVVMQAIQRHEYPRVYWGHVARNGGDMLAKLSNV
ncbi:hypothetical protein A2U01_0073623, partial [Trifolium medium]|nr:hypothetical protein [Trifolium medium]